MQNTGAGRIRNVQKYENVVSRDNMATNEQFRLIDGLNKQKFITQTYSD